jgi:hypothetical protein
MNEEEPECSCLIDTSGLHALATASGNLKALLLDSLQAGIIAVPSHAWQEFEDLYEDEAAALSAYVSTKINMKKATYIGAARIADQLNSGFSRGPYDNHSVLYTASMACNNGYRVLTASNAINDYDGMDCEVSDLETWAEGLSGE